MLGELHDEIGERNQIRVVGCPGNEQMHVIGHEAVRNYCEPASRRSSRNLLEHLADDRAMSEDF